MAKPMFDAAYIQSLTENPEARTAAGNFAQVIVSQYGDDILAEKGMLPVLAHLFIAVGTAVQGFEYADLQDILDTAIDVHVGLDEDDEVAEDMSGVAIPETTTEVDLPANATKEQLAKTVIEGLAKHFGLKVAVS